MSRITYTLVGGTPLTDAEREALIEYDRQEAEARSAALGMTMEEYQEYLFKKGAEASQRIHELFQDPAIMFLSPEEQFQKGLDIVNEFLNDKDKMPVRH